MIINVKGQISADPYKKPIQISGFRGDAINVSLDLLVKPEDIAELFQMVGTELNIVITDTDINIE